jgi:hypothetical protein
MDIRTLIKLSKAKESTHTSNRAENVEIFKVNGKEKIIIHVAYIGFLYRSYVSHYLYR